jgi:chaperonin GroEL
MITTEAMIVDMPEDSKEPSGGAGGMGGMGGMGY